MRKLSLTFISLFFIALITGCGEHGHDHDENGGHPHDAPAHHDSLK